MLFTANTSAWSFLAVPLFCMPAYLPVTAASVNYAPVVFVAFVGICSAWYFAWGRKNYQGPPKEELDESMVNDGALSGVDAPDAYVGAAAKKD